ncbi:hypothetical protein AVP41_00814 [Microbacterium sp. TNHR37B]|nr:hypothetical protein AVP41_00814 [Microbacterium sp. TNHR37B]
MGVSMTARTEVSVGTGKLVGYTTKRSRNGSHEAANR